MNKRGLSSIAFFNHFIMTFYISYAFISLNRDLVAELPFILMHPKPEEEEPNPILADRSSKHSTAAGQRSDDANENATNQVTTGNLIQFGWETLKLTRTESVNSNSNNTIPLFFLFPPIKQYSDEDFKDDDIIFEDFARLRLKGGETET